MTFGLTTTMKPPYWAGVVMLVASTTACDQVTDAVMGEVHEDACLEACKKADTSSCQSTCESVCRVGCDPGSYSYSSTDRVECSTDSVVFVDEGGIITEDKKLTCDR